jgi:hypothetical protein
MNLDRLRPEACRDGHRRGGGRVAEALRDRIGADVAVTNGLRLLSQT